MASQTQALVSREVPKVMAFAQLTGRDGSRDIEVCLQSQRDKLYRMGFGGRVSRSTLADANANRSFLIYSAATTASTTS